MPNPEEYEAQEEQEAQNEFAEFEASEGLPEDQGPDEAPSDPGSDGSDTFDGKRGKGQGPHAERGDEAYQNIRQDKVEAFLANKFPGEFESASDPRDAGDRTVFATSVEKPILNPNEEQKQRSDRANKSNG